MANSVIPIIQGREYQARYFWLQACDLFKDNSDVAQVGYEINEVKSFDDVVVYYNKPKQDELGTSYHIDYYQIKFHVDYSGAFTFENLTDPKLIGATAVSLLQKLRDAVQKHRIPDQAVRFYIVSNWSILHNDSLGELISGSNGGIRLSILLKGGPNSKYGKVRSLWKEHLGISNDDELCEILRPLRFKSGYANLAEIGRQLNENLERVGLVPVREGRLVNPYDDLIGKLIQIGKNRFDRSELQNICEGEGLWKGKKITDDSRPLKIGVRSRMRYAENMEHETDHMLCLVRYFNDRFIYANNLWNDKLFPELQEFLAHTIKRGQPYYLRLDTHSSIAFSAGYCLDSKLGADVTIIQPTSSGELYWQVEQHKTSANYPDWDITGTSSDSNGNEVAVAMSISQPIKADVELFVNTSLPNVGRIINFTIKPNVGKLAIHDGTHSFILANIVSTWLKTNLSFDERSSLVHVFIIRPQCVCIPVGSTCPWLRSLYAIRV